jgi:curved DNA-binding protein CbpA
MSTEFDPKKIIDFSKDYYEILGLSKDVFPNGKSRQDKIRSSEILEKAFRIKSRSCHPDFGGSNEAFLDIVRARRILEDPILKKIYDQGYFDEFKIGNDEFGFDVDWDKIGTYRKGTPEDTIGFSLFLKICENKEELNLIPAFYPETPDHNYEWDWVIRDTKSKLVISIVNDENEVLRLTSGSSIDNSLPFKIYVCIPRASLSMKRDNSQVLSPDGKALVNGIIQSASYSDYNLLETTSLEAAQNYIQNQLEIDINKFLNGDTKTFVVNESKTTWLDSEKLKKYDQEKLASILNMKSFVVQDDPNAADFIDKITD